MSENEKTEGRGTQGGSAIFLIAIGAAGLGYLLYANGSLGWSLGTTAPDRYAMGLLHILPDLAAAALVVAAGIMFAFRTWAWRGLAVLAMALAFAFSAWSMVSVFGFMSTRVAATQSRATVVEMQMGNIDWLKQQTVSPAVADAYANAAAECATGRGPRCLGAEARAEALAKQQANMSKELRQQFKEAQATASEVHDKQAAALAVALGYTQETVQLWLQTIWSGVAHIAKFAGLFFGFMLLPQMTGRKFNKQEFKAPEFNADTGSNGSSSTSSNEPQVPEEQKKTPATPEFNNVVPMTPRAHSAPPPAQQFKPGRVHKMSEQEALNFCLEQVARSGAPPAQATLARKSGRTKSHISKWCKGWAEEGHEWARQMTRSSKPKAASKFGLGTRHQPTAAASA